MPNEEAVVRPQVALFIDLENIRYSFLNEFKFEPDFKEMMERGRSKGPVTVAFAYADFTRHPEAVRRKLETLGVTCRDIPVREINGSVEGEKRIKSSADHQMMLDIVETVLDRPKVGVFVLATGDSDFMRILTMLRNRFEKKVLLIGVPRTMSRDLIEAADEVLRLEPVLVTEDNPIIGAIVQMMTNKVPGVGFWTLPQVSNWANNPRNQIPGNDFEHSAVITYMVQNGLIKQETRPAEGNLTERRVSKINEEHPLVKKFLGTDDSVASYNEAEENPLLDTLFDSLSTDSEEAQVEEEATSDSQSNDWGLHSEI